MASPVEAILQLTIGCWIPGPASEAGEVETLGLQANLSYTLVSPPPLSGCSTVLEGRGHSTRAAGVRLPFTSGTWSGIPSSPSSLLFLSEWGVGYSMLANHESTLVQDVLGVT